MRTNHTSRTSREKWKPNKWHRHSSGGHVLKPTSAVLQPTGFVLDPTGVVLESTGAVLEPAGVVLESTGIVLVPTGAARDCSGAHRGFYGALRNCSGAYTDYSVAYRGCWGPQMEFGAPLCRSGAFRRCFVSASIVLEFAEPVLELTVYCIFVVRMPWGPWVC